MVRRRSRTALATRSSRRHSLSHPRSVRPRRSSRLAAVAATPAVPMSPRRRWLWWALVLLQGATLVQLVLLHQKQQQLEAVFACTERRFNNPGTFGGTRCFDPGNPQFSPRPLAESAPIQP